MHAEVKLLLDDAVQDMGLELDRTTEEVAAFTAIRTAHLATLVGQPGYEMAVIAERDNIIAFAAMRAANKYDARQERVVGIIQTALYFGAHIISKGII